MSQTIDNRIVEMQFDNKDFEKNVEQSLSTLDKLKQALKLDDAAKNLQDLGKAAKQFDLNSIGEAVEALQGRFSTLGIAGMTVISDLTRAAANMAKKILTAIPAQIKSGGMTRALNIEQARFQLKGLGLDVQQVEEDAMYAVEGTAYGFDEAARVAAQFGASGVKAGEDMKNALLGVSGVAAMTGRSYSDIGNIFTTVASNGKLMTMQLRQFSASGLNVSAALAKYFGRTEQEINDMVQKGKISFEDFSNAMYETFGEHAKEANNTFQGSLSNMKAALSRIGADFAAPYIDNMKYIFNGLKNFFNGWRTALKPFVTDFTWAMQTVTSKAILFFGDKRWTDINETFIKGLQTGLYNLVRVIGTVSYAFRNMFPGITMNNFQKLVHWITDFTSKLTLSDNALQGLYRVVTVLLTPIRWIYDIGKKLVTSVIAPLILKIHSFIDASLRVVNILGNVRSALRDAIKQSSSYQKFFKSIRTMLSRIKSLLLDVKERIKNIFSISSDGNVLVRILEKVYKALYVISVLSLEGLAFVLDKISKIRFDKIINSIKLFGAGILSVIKNVTRLPIIQKIFQAITLVIGGLVLAIKEVVQWFKNLFERVRDGETIFEALKEKILGIFESFKTLKERLNGIFGEGGFRTLFKDLPEAFTDLKDKIIDFVSTIREKFSDLDMSKLLLTAFAFAVIASLLKMSNAIEATAKSIKNITGIGASIQNFLTNFTKRTTLGFTVIQIAIAIGMLAGSLALLTKLDSTKLKMSSIALGSLTVVLAILAGVLTKLANGGKNTKALQQTFRNYAAIMGALAVGTLAIAGALKILETIDPSKVLSSIALLIGALGGLTAASIALSIFAPELSKNALTLVALGFAIGQVVKALASVSEIDFSNLGANILEFMSIIGAIALLTMIAGNIRLSSALGIVLIVGYVKMLVPVVKELTSLDFSNFKKVLEEHKTTVIALAGLIGGFLLLAEAMTAFGGKNMMRASTAFFSLGVLALALGGAAKIFESLSWSGLGKAVIGLGTVATIFGIITAIMQKGQYVFGFGKDAKVISSYKGVAAVFLSLSVLGLALAGAAKIFSNIPFNGFIKGIVGLGSVATIFGIISVILTHGEKVNKGKIAGMVTTILAIMTLVGSIVVLGGVIASSEKAAEAIRLASSYLFLMMLGIAAVAACINGKEPKTKELTHTKKSNWQEMLMVLGMMGMLAGAVYACYQAIGPNNSQWKRLATSLGIVFGALGLVLLAVYEFNKQINSMHDGKISKFNEAASKQLTRHLWALVGALAAIEALVIAAVMLDPGEVDKAKGVLIATGLLWGVIAGGAVGMLLAAKKIGNNSAANKNLERYLIELSSIMVAMGGLVAALEYIPHDKNVWKKFGLLSSLIGEVAVLVTAMTIANERITNGTVGVAGFATAFDIVAVGIAALAGVLWAVSKVEYDAQMSTKLWALAGLTTIIAAFLAGMQAIGTSSGGLSALIALGSGGAFILVSVGIIALAKGFSELAEVPWQKLKDGLSGWDTLWMFVKILGVLLGIGIAATAGIAGLVGITAVLIGLGAATAGISMLVDALADLVATGADVKQLGSDLAIGIDNFLNTLADRAGSIGEAIARLISTILMKIAEIQETIFASLTVILNNTADFVITTLGPLVAKVLMALLLIIGETIDENMIHITDLATRLILHFIEGVEVGLIHNQDTINRVFENLFVVAVANMRATVTQPLLDLGGHIVDKLKEGIEPKLVELKSWLILKIAEVIESAFGDNVFSSYLKQQGEAVMTNYASGMSNETPSTKTILKEAGKRSIQNMVLGTLEGLEQNHPLLATLGGKAANIFWEDGWRDEIGDHSGWDAAHESMGNMALGVLEGVIQNAGSFMSGGAQAGGLVGGAFKEIVAQAGQEGMSYMASLAGSVNFLSGMFNNHTKAVNDAIKAYNKGGMSSRELEERLRSTNKVGTETNGILDYIQKGLGKLTESVGDAIPGLDDFGKSLGGAGSAAKSAKEDIDNLYDSMLQTIEGSMNIFDKFEDKDPMSADQMLENMHSQINGMTSWAADMNKLATMGIDQGLLQKLAELGPEGRDKVHAFATMTADQMAEANTLWAQSLALPKQVTDMMMYDMQVAGANAALGLGDGIKSEAEAAADEAKAMGDEVVRTVKEDSLEEQSPSKVMHQIGAYATEGLRKGMASMQKLLFNQAEYIANRVVEIMTQGLSPDKFGTIGVGVVDGIIQGVESKTSILRTAISKLATAATTAAKSKSGFDVNSPSKKFIPIGENITEGLVVGIERSTGSLINSIDNQAGTALDGMRNIVSSISQMITDDMQDPVIRPVLDLSNVQAGARTLSSLFSTNQALSASASMNTLQNGKSIAGGTTFIQNNYSPKALTRTEIYRQTRNQLSQYRAGLS